MNDLLKKYTLNFKPFREPVENMNMVKTIYVPNEPQNGIAIFYDSIMYKGQSFEEKSNHCEMFFKEDCTSIGLNENSFVLRFGESSKRRIRSIKFHIPDERRETVIEELAELSDFIWGEPLKVMKHFDILNLQNQLK